jgi:hypothetical protein
MAKIILPDPITFVNINEWFGMDGRGVCKIGDYENQARKNSRFEALISGLKKINPDLVAIQEANKLPMIYLFQTILGSRWFLMNCLCRKNKLHRNQVTSDLKLRMLIIF